MEVDADPLPAIIQKEKDEKYPGPDNGFCPHLMVVEIKETGWNKDPVRGNVRDVVFKDIQVFTKKQIPASEFSGYDDTHTTENVTIENLVINGKKAADLEQGQCSVGQFAQGVKLV